MADRTVKVVLQAVTSGFSASMARAGAQAESLRQVLGKVEAQAAGVSQVQAFDKLAGGMVKAGAALTAAAGLAGKAAIDWESQFAGVRKTVDGTADEIGRIEASLRQMARTMPATHAEIAATAEAAGQLGVSTGAISEFTEVMLKLGETTNLSADEAATSLAQFANITQMTEDNYGRLGAVVVDLGNKGASTEAQIVQMGQRIAGAGNQMGMTEAQIMGVASAIASTGINVEAGGSAISRVLKQVDDQVRGAGEGLNALAEISGMSAAQFTAAWRSDAGGALNAFVTGLGQAGAAGQSMTGILDRLGISGVYNQDVMLRLAQAGGLLGENLANANQAWSAGSALNDEYAKRAETTAAKIQVAINSVKDAAIDFGAAIAPAVGAFAQAVQGVSGVLTQIPAPLKQLAGAAAGVAGPIVLAAGGVLKLRQAAAGMRGTLQALPAMFGRATTAAGRLATKTATASSRTSQASVAMASLGTQTGTAATGLHKAGERAGQAGRQIDKTSSKAKQASRDMASLGRASQQAGEQIGVAGAKTDAANTSLGRMGKLAGGARSIIGGLGKGLAGLGIATGVLAGVSALANSLSGAATSSEKLAANLDRVTGGGAGLQVDQYRGAGFGRINNLQGVYQDIYGNEAGTWLREKAFGLFNVEASKENLANANQVLAEAIQSGSQSRQQAIEAMRAVIGERMSADLSYEQLAEIAYNAEHGQGAWKKATSSAGTSNRILPTVSEEQIRKTQAQIQATGGAGGWYADYGKYLSEMGEPVEALKSQVSQAIGRSLTDNEAMAIILEGKYPQELRDASLATDQLTGSMRDLAAEAGNVDANVSLLSESLNSHATAALAASGAAISWEGALDAANETIAANGALIDKNTGLVDISVEKGRENQQALDAMAAAALANAENMRTMGDSQEEVNQFLTQARTEFIAAAQAAGLTGQAAADLANTYNLIPDTVLTSLAALGIDVSAEDVTSYKQLIESVPAEKKTLLATLGIDAGMLAVKGWAGAIDAIPAEKKTELAAKGVDLEVLKVDGLQAAIDAIPAEKKTELKALGADAATSKVTSFLAQLDKIRAVKDVLVRVKTASLGAGPLQYQAKSGGGLVVGPGTSTSDSIPAMLSNGEYVIRAAAASRIGLAHLEWLNRHATIPHFAAGGPVEGARYTPRQAATQPQTFPTLEGMTITGSLKMVGSQAVIEGVVAGAIDRWAGHQQAIAATRGRVRP